MAKKKIEPGSIVAMAIAGLALLTALIYSFTIPVPAPSRVIGLVLWAASGWWIWAFSKDIIRPKSEAVRILSMAFGAMFLLALGFGFLVGFYNYVT